MENMNQNRDAQHLSDRFDECLCAHGPREVVRTVDNYRNTVNTAGVNDEGSGTKPMQHFIHLYQYMHYIEFIPI